MNERKEIIVPIGVEAPIVNEYSSLVSLVSSMTLTTKLETMFQPDFRVNLNHKRSRKACAPSWETEIEKHSQPFLCFGVDADVVDLAVCSGKSGSTFPRSAPSSTSC